MPARKSRKDMESHVLETHPEAMFLAGDERERAASMAGQAAMYVFEKVEGTPGEKRMRILHVLRFAARRCPNAAYNLASIMSGWPAPARRRKRAALAMSLYGHAVEMGLGRMRRPDEGANAAPADEYWLRDVVSRALTNIGAAVSNSGRPEDAVAYFRKALAVFDGNATAHACYGNMGVHHWRDTGVPPQDGIREWERAAALGDDCHESDHGCPCRANVIRIYRRLETDYGTDEAVTWLTERYPGLSMRKRSDELTTPVREAAEIGTLAGSRWPGRAVQAANVIGDSEILSVMKDSPLEAKVTLAGCVLALFARMDGAHAAEGHVAQALETLEHVESLHPFLGDDEWEHVELPRSGYLLEDEVKGRLMTMSEHLKRQVKGAIPRLTAEEAVKGFLFHVDPVFREGIMKMVGHALRVTPEGQDVYVPAMEVGSPQGRPN